MPRLIGSWHRPATPRLVTSLSEALIGNRRLDFLIRKSRREILRQVVERGISVLSPYSLTWYSCIICSYHADAKIWPQNQLYNNMNLADSSIQSKLSTVGIHIALITLKIDVFTNYSTNIIALHEYQIILYGKRPQCSFPRPGARSRASTSLLGRRDGYRSVPYVPKTAVINWLSISFSLSL